MPHKEKAKKRIAVIGYGSQGRAIALNLRDSGWDVAVGVRRGSKSLSRAKKDGLRNVGPISKVVAESDIVCFAFPDHLHGRVFNQSIGPHLKSGATLWFLHGTSIQFGFVQPPDNSDVILIAPHAPGLAVREKFLTDRSISAFYAIHRDGSRRARSLAFALADACGFKRSRLVKTTFHDEAVGDLFGEQAVLCGGLAMLISAGYETLVNRGIKPEHAYLEVAYQLDLIIALIKQYGMSGMWERISVAARYGSLLTGQKLIDRSTKSRMQAALAEIESGRFPRRLESLTEKDISRISKALNALTPRSFDRAARKYQKR